MNENTSTMWLILMTPQKRILARISKLKTYGKIKIGEWKVMYGKNKFSGWVFRVLGQNKSRTFSFHDGEVLANTANGYLPLRKFSFRIYIIGGVLCCCWLSWVSIQNVHVKEGLSEPQAKLPLPVVEIEKAPIQPVQTAPVQKIYEPKFHDIFLEAKRAFQFGKLDASSKIFLHHLDDFDPDDRAMANSMIAERYYLECQKWIRENENRKAVLACEKATKYSSHEKASAFLREQDEKAKQLYLEGYTAVKLDPIFAKQKFTQVLQMAKSKSTWRGKAQYQLRKLKVKDSTI